jgi:hypothetical protein
MGVIDTFIVQYKKCKTHNKLAILYECEMGLWYIKYTTNDELGWRENIDKIPAIEADALI